MRSRSASNASAISSTSDSASTENMQIIVKLLNGENVTLPVRGGGPKKLRCTFKDCKDQAQRIVGDCSFCQGQFCGKHRMLEDHKCSGLEDCKKESHERNADKLNSERTIVVKGI
ncbi:MAG: hypothetical protein Q9209_007001 [Squamulea sp. 1 TL-2023]